ncbi:hypothetical protein C8R43DRAFT_1173909 [Mycena crocata]|nr:hypothetical protein C8R43DRAFT_1173909 [Mycena crocata]
MSGVLDADRARLEDVEAEMLTMLGLKLAFNLLRMERSSIQGRLSAYKYPVLTLPNEIVSEIFLHFLPAYPDCPTMTGPLSPTLLTHICRKWRQIALNTPSLWRAIPFPLDLDPSQRVPMLQSWLSRSRVCPLSIEINDNPRYMDVRDALQALLMHRLRWEYLKLTVCGCKLHILESPTPLLRELDLHVHCKSPSSPVSTKCAPLLRTFILNDCAAAHVILPWAQLTSLTLLIMFPSECSPILLQTCNLVHCELYLTAGEDDGTQPDVKLPRLETLLTYAELSTHGTAKYLGTFVVPALRTLLVPEVYLGQHPVVELTSFISKSGCKLQEVHIVRRRSTPKDLYRRALSLVPKLTFDEWRSVSREL